MVDIHSEYRNFVPPEWVYPTVQRLLASLSDAHTRGLASIVLTECVIATTREGSRRMRRTRKGIPLGLYHPAWMGELPWIELVVDQIVTQLPPSPFSKLQIYRDYAVGRVLFHEIGHHLETTIGSAARTGEPAAEAWQRRLWRQHLQQRYWYFRPLKFLFRWLRQFARFMAARQRARSGTESSNPTILKS